MQTLDVRVDDVGLKKCDSHNVASEFTVSATDIPYSPTSALSPLEAAQTHEDDAYPEGGLRAWLTVFGAFLALFCTFGQLNSFGTFQSWYADHQLHHLPQSTISWIGSLQLWVFFFSVSRPAPIDDHEVEQAFDRVALLGGFLTRMVRTSS